MTKKAPNKITIAGLSVGAPSGIIAVSTRLNSAGLCGVRTKKEYHTTIGIMIW